MALALNDFLVQNKGGKSDEFVNGIVKILNHNDIESVAELVQPIMHTRH